MKMNKWVALSAILAIASTASVSRVIARSPQALAAGIGSFKGKVLSAKGAPVTGCPIKLYVEFDPNGGVGGTKKGTGLGHPQVTDLMFGRPIAQAVSNEKGEFEFKQLKEGNYEYIAGNQKLGLGGGSITIEANKAAAADVTLSN